MSHASQIVPRLHGPRERLTWRGPEAASDEDLLAILLGTGMRGAPVLALAERVLDGVSGLQGLRRLGVGGLSAIPGIGPSKAARIVASVELGRRLSSRPNLHSPISSSADLYAAVLPRLKGRLTESFVAVPVDAKNKPLGCLTVGRGDAVSCPLRAGDVFRRVLMEGPVSVFFAHNHPSGDPEPSPADLRLTQQLVRAGELLGIQVLDHLVVGHDAYYSFADAGLIALRVP